MAAMKWKSAVRNAVLQVNDYNDDSVRELPSFSFDFRRSLIMEAVSLHMSSLCHYCMFLT